MPRTAAAPKPVRRCSSGLRTRAESVAAAERRFTALPGPSLDPSLDSRRRPEREACEHEIVFVARDMLGGGAGDIP